MTGSRAALTRTLVAAGVLAYLGAAAAGSLLSGAALFQLSHRQMPRGVTLSTAPAYWKATAGDERERRKLLACLALPALVLGIIVPAAAAGAAQRRRPLHGAARFANAMEIRKAGLHAPKGILLGRFREQYLILDGQQSVLLSAPMRSGKGVGVVVPNLLAWPDSACVLDIKHENFNITAGYRAAHGQAVHVWAPFAQDGRSHRWNPLGYVRTDPRFSVGDILAIGQVLYPAVTKGTGTEAFFNDQARNLFLGLSLYLVETPERPRSIGELLRQSSGEGRPLREHLERLIKEREASERPLSPACIDALMRFLSNSDNTLSSVLATLNAPLTVFADPFVDAATSDNDFSLPDLRRKRITVYLCIPPNRLPDAAVLLNLFFSQLVNLNTEVLPEHDPTLKYQCLLVLDEATAMGRVGVLAKAIGYLAGYNLRVLTIIQAVSQLDSVYGKDDARTFATNHAAQILYAPREQRDANEYSEMLGTFTETGISRGRSTSHGKGGGGSTSRNESEQRRALLLPQEFKELGRDREVIVVENAKPILADKIRYYDDPVFKARLLPPPEIPVLPMPAGVVPRARPVAAPGDEDRIDIDPGRLPVIAEDATEAELTAFVDAFFQQLPMVQLPAPADGHDLPELVQVTS